MVSFAGITPYTHIPSPDTQPQWQHPEADNQSLNEPVIRKYQLREQQ